jgi:hypothetical protein
LQKKFQKKIEDFVCSNCKKSVKGTGYTNHCPYCLWSRHVDINPGDREEKCRGEMKPISAYYVRGKWKLIHRCSVCNVKREVFAVKNDNMESIIQLSIANMK